MKSQLPMAVIEAAAKAGKLVFERFGPSDGCCEYCGRYGWSYLIAVAEPGDDLDGHIQNSPQIWSLGPDCFKAIKRLVNGKIREFRSKG
jgi:hypothetical protein